MADARPGGNTEWTKVHGYDGYEGLNPPIKHTWWYKTRHSPASNSPEKRGRYAKNDRQEHNRTQPHVQDRQSTVAVGEASPKVRASEAADHERRRQVTRVKTCVVVVAPMRMQQG